MDFRNIFNKIEEAMAAAAFAEQGEFDTARQMLGRNKNTNKKVLLGIDETEVDPKIFRYALCLCQRVGAKLEVLHVLGSGSEEVARGNAPSLQQSSGKEIDYTMIANSDNLEDVVAARTKDRRDILFVVLGAALARKKSLQKANRQTLTEVFEKFRCPVVVYSETAGT